MQLMSFKELLDRDSSDYSINESSKLSNNFKKFIELYNDMNIKFINDYEKKEDFENLIPKSNIIDTELMTANNDILSFNVRVKYYDNLEDRKYLGTFVVEYNIKKDTLTGFWLQGGDLI